MKRLFLFLFFCYCSQVAFCQAGKGAFTRLDTLFGSNTPQRAWWDVKRYDLEITPHYETKTIKGRNSITYTVLPNQTSDYIQVDLQEPLGIDTILYNGKPYINYPLKPSYREGGHWFIPLPREKPGSTQSLTICYSGKPKEALNAPWQGGWVWAKDKKGRPWMSVACQGDGASIWYPCKDLWSDEPDEGASLTVHVDKALTAVGNGRLKQKTVGTKKASYRWEVKAPINAYNIIPYIGHYTSWTETFPGENGPLDLSYWVLDYEQEKAKKQFVQAQKTLQTFEHWFGPYPFYRDGYKLVQSPYLGMEHQSAVAYGNEFKNGYLGSDLSGTGWGLKWDYIIVHETGHEWFGNNITASDMADMWVHEAFTDYAETLFTESNFGKKAANEYLQGLRKNILNDTPIIGPYGVRREGSGDMYYKGANIIHTIRQVIDNDSLFRKILRGLNSTFYRQTVTSKQVEDYFATKSGKKLAPVFDQYLRTATVPVLTYRQAGRKIEYRWTNTIADFDMPIRLANGLWLRPTQSWQTLTLADTDQFSVDKNFYINVKKL